PLAGYAFDFFRTYTIPIAASAAAMFVGSVLMYLAPEPGEAGSRQIPALKARGAGLITCAPPGAGRSPASAGRLGAIAPKDKKPTHPREAGRIGQDLRREALRALGLHERGNQRHGVIGERRRAHRLLAEFCAIATGETAIASGIGSREPGPLERGVREDLRIV